MTEFATTADTFLALVAPNRRDRCAKALDLLCRATEGSPLYNVDYKDAKETLGRAWEEMYRDRVRAPWLHGKGCNPQADLDSHLNCYQLHTTPGQLKKLNKLKPATRVGYQKTTRFDEVDPAMVAACREALEAAVPLAELVKELKAQVVKGRKPNNTEPDPEALAKQAAKRTCPCCFRAMALNKGGLVMRHGWQEQGGRRAGSYGNAWHVGECFGVGYAPYEVSCQGTKDFREVLLRTKAQMEKGLATLEARPAKLRGSYTKGYGRNAETVKFELEDDGGDLENLTYADRRDSYSNPTGSYAWNLKQRLDAAKRDLKALQHDLDFLTKAVEDWKAA
jgi:hypothetical protein